MVSGNGGGGVVVQTSSLLHLKARTATENINPAEMGRETGSRTSERGGPDE